MTLKDLFINARRVSAPILVGRTPDPTAFMAKLLSYLGADSPAVRWDLMNGIMGLNPAGRIVADRLNGGEDPAIATANPSDALRKLAAAPTRTIVFMLNAHKVWTDPQILQGIWNLRDLYKTDRRTLVLMARTSAPAEIQDDVILLEEKRPTVDELSAIVSGIAAGSNVALSPDLVTKSAEALSGMAAFNAETAAAICLKPDGISVPDLWEQKFTKINSTKGLSIYRGGETVADIGGCEAVIEFLKRLANGTDPYTSTVWLDEVEKSMAGAAGDLTGTSQDQLAALLQRLQDMNALGLMFLGHPGSAKSLLAKASGPLVGGPVIQFDLGGMKASLVGESEANVREALDVVEAVGGRRPLWIATCNGIASLPPEFRRRFKLGTFFFDLPSEVERAKILPIYLKKYKLNAKQPLPDMTDWTGAEIANLCYLASTLSISLVQAATYIVPLALSAADKVAKLRQECSGRYLSANTAGVYQMNAGNSAPDLNVPPGVVRRLVNMKES